VITQYMNGWELSQAIRGVRPETAVLFMSGYADEVIGRYGVLDPGISLLQKPFTGQELGRKLREVLTCKRPTSAAS
jgi:two-component system, cell cycle sensor histidine kinase and response regulator CckA